MPQVIGVVQQQAYAFSMWRRMCAGASDCSGQVVKHMVAMLLLLLGRITHKPDRLCAAALLLLCRMLLWLMSTL